MELDGWGLNFYLRERRNRANILRDSLTFGINNHLAACWQIFGQPHQAAPTISLREGVRVRAERQGGQRGRAIQERA